MASTQQFTKEVLDNTWQDPTQRSPLVLGDADFNDVTQAICGIHERKSGGLGWWAA